MRKRCLHIEISLWVWKVLYPGYLIDFVFEKREKKDDTHRGSNLEQIADSGAHERSELLRCPSELGMSLPNLGTESLPSCR